MRHRRLLPGAAVSEGGPTEEELSLHLPLIRAALTGESPIELVLPAFPAKSPSPRKVLGKLPDMAERVALRSLKTLCEELAEAHPPGVRMLLCSDGLVFADVVSVSDEDEETLKGFLGLRKEPFLELVTHDQMRQSFVAHGVSGTPTFVLVDKDGVVRFRQVGYSEGKGLTIDGWSWGKK